MKYKQYNHFEYCIPKIVYAQCKHFIFLKILTKIGTWLTLQNLIG